jgi:dienelactone hydrolase
VACSWGTPAIEDVVAWLREQPWADTDRVCVAGFCVGGGAALRWADQRPSTGNAPAVAVFYGRPLERLQNLRGPVLGIFGAQDSQFPGAQVRMDSFSPLSPSVRSERKLDHCLTL